jgi:hypothetical protein
MMFIMEMKCTFKATETPTRLMLQPSLLEADVLLCI